MSDRVTARERAPVNPCSIFVVGLLLLVGLIAIAELIFIVSM
jgi:hypothetical protein